jgi:hypothetical protein
MVENYLYTSLRAIEGPRQMPMNFSRQWRLNSRSIMRAHLSWQLRLLSICILPLSSTLLKAAPSSAKPVARPVTTGSLFYVDIDPPLFIQFENGIRSKFGHDLNAPAWIYAKAFDEVWFARRLVDTHPVGGIVVNRELAFGNSINRRTSDYTALSFSYSCS